MAWVHVPETDYPFALALAVLISDCNSPNQVSRRDAMSNLTSIPSTNLSPHSGPDTWLRLQSGMTSRPSTAALGVGSLIRFSLDIHASRSVRQGNGLARTTNATYGLTWLASSGRSALDGYSSKTWQGISASGSKRFSGSYAKWASTLRPSHSARRKSVPLTNDSESSLWHTTKTTAGGYTRDGGVKGKESLTLQGQAERARLSTARAEDGERAGMRHSRGVADTLTAQARLWGTPSAGLANYDENPGTFAQRGQELKSRGHSAQGANLGQQAQIFPTPKALTGGANSRRKERGAGGPDLQEFVQDQPWPTASARDWKDTPGMAIEGTNPDGSTRQRQDQLARVAHTFSHLHQETRLPGLISFKRRRILHRLLADAGLFTHPRSISRPYSIPTRRTPENSARAAWRRQASYQRWRRKRLKYWLGRRLNPLFVEHLMGWPPGHALSSCSAMEFVLWQHRMRSAILPVTSDLHPSIWEPSSAADNYVPPEQGSLF